MKKLEMVDLPELGKMINKLLSFWDDLLAR